MENDFISSNSLINQQQQQLNNNNNNINTNSNNTINTNNNNNNITNNYLTSVLDNNLSSPIINSTINNNNNNNIVDSPPLALRNNNNLYSNNFNNNNNNSTNNFISTPSTPTTQSTPGTPTTQQQYFYNNNTVNNNNNNNINNSTDLFLNNLNNNSKFIVPSKPKLNNLFFNNNNNNNTTTNSINHNLNNSGNKIYFKNMSDVTSDYSNSKLYNSNGCSNLLTGSFNNILNSTNTNVVNNNNNNNNDGNDNNNNVPQFNIGSNNHHNNNHHSHNNNNNNNNGNNQPLSYSYESLFNNLYNDIQHQHQHTTTTTTTTNNNHLMGYPLNVTPSSDISSPSPPSSTSMASNASSPPVQISPLQSPSNHLSPMSPSINNHHIHHNNNNNNNNHHNHHNNNNGTMSHIDAFNRVSQLTSASSNPKKLKRDYDQSFSKDEWEDYIPQSKYYQLFNYSKNDLSGSFTFKVKRTDKNIQFSDLDSAWILYRQNRFQVDCDIVGSLESWSNIDRNNVLYVNGNSSGNNNNNESLTEVNGLFFTLYVLKFSDATNTTTSNDQNDRVPIHQLGGATGKKDRLTVEPSPVVKGRGCWNKLQFGSATSNNARVHPDQPNPNQQFFRVVITLNAAIDKTNVDPNSTFNTPHFLPIVSKISPPMIVRGQNPGRFLNHDKSLKKDPNSSPSSKPNGSNGSNGSGSNNGSPSTGNGSSGSSNNGGTGNSNNSKHHKSYLNTSHSDNSDEEAKDGATTTTTELSSSPPQTTTTTTTTTTSASTSNNIIYNNPTIVDNNNNLTNMLLQQQQQQLTTTTTTTTNDSLQDQLTSLQQQQQHTIVEMDENTINSTIGIINTNNGVDELMTYQQQTTIDLSLLIQQQQQQLDELKNANAVNAANAAANNSNTTNPFQFLNNPLLNTNIQQSLFLNQNLPGVSTNPIINNNNNILMSTPITMIDPTIPTTTTTTTTTQQQQQSIVKNKVAKWNTNPFLEESIYTNKQVGINTTTPSQALTVNGNIMVTGELFKPSDKRIKSNIRRDKSNHWDKINRLKIYDYDRKKMMGYDDPNNNGTTTESVTVKEKGFLAQEVQEVLPNAVKVAGDVKLQDGSTIPSLLVVNDRALLLENIGATQQIGRSLKKERDHIVKIDRDLDRVKIEGSRENHAILTRMQDMVNFMHSEETDRLNSEESSIYCSLMGLGPAWTMFVFGFFVPFCWIIGSFFLFSPTRVKWVSGLTNFVATIFFILTLSLMVFYIPDLASIILVPSLLFMGFSVCITVGFFRQRNREKKRYLRERLKLMQTDGYKNLVDHVSNFRVDYAQTQSKINGGAGVNGRNNVNLKKKKRRVLNEVNVNGSGRVGLNNVNSNNLNNASNCQQNSNGLCNSGGVVNGNGNGNGSKLSSSISEKLSESKSSFIDDFKKSSGNNHKDFQEIPLQEIIQNIGIKGKRNNNGNTNSTKTRSTSISSSSSFSKTNLVDSNNSNSVVFNSIEV